MKESGSPVLMKNTSGTIKFRNLADSADLLLGNAPATHTHLLAAGATDVTVTAAQLNLISAFLKTTLHVNKILNGTTKKQIVNNSSDGTKAYSPADADKFQCNIIASGTETKMSISHIRKNDAPKFDIYINGVQDGGTTDQYAAVETPTYTEITLTQSITAGNNLIEFRVNGKNVLSSGYQFRFLGGAVY